ncbi:MAG: metallophosphoesterase family protein [Armatimonadota bacterium]|nr:metallophosphoesterase family protein [Armatimonadota bacterium]MDR5697009.1 metallophosphoesterase family protein [Armatimonadota bacterium]
MLRHAGMLYAILSDVHANLDALEVVLADVAGSGAEQVICLGDFVGYGPEPNECTERLRSVATVALVGNHDLAALDRLDAGRFNLFARLAVEWTKLQLEESIRHYLESLPATREYGGLLLVHGSPRDPVEEYIMDLETADDNFRAADFEICFFGHTHYPVWFVHDGERTRMRALAPGERAALRGGQRHLINVGSVGQPRDGDPRAAYCLFDSDARVVELRRLPYPIESVQQKMRDRELPRPLWERLAEGR